MTHFIYYENFPSAEQNTKNEEEKSNCKTNEEKSKQVNERQLPKEQDFGESKAYPLFPLLNK